MAGEVLDLDVELDKLGLTEETLTIRLFGEEWQVPAEPPLLIARKVMAMIQHAFNQDPDLAVEDVPGLDPDLFEADLLAARLCGQENVDAWLARGITGKGLWTVIVNVITAQSQHARSSAEDEPAAAEEEPAPVARPAAKKSPGKKSSGKAAR